MFCVLDPFLWLPCISAELNFGSVCTSRVSLVADIYNPKFMACLFDFLHFWWFTVHTAIKVCFFIWNLDQDHLALAVSDAVSGITVFRPDTTPGFGSNGLNTAYLKAWFFPRVQLVQNQLSETDASICLLWQRNIIDGFSSLARGQYNTLRWHNLREKVSSENTKEWIKSHSL